ncbi:hypothetical protein GA0070624_2114 [Micromonospora rhizosphaerae]|uniref:Uncharacterized protein n=1 Tax=Micromonospora rhizosphaerae TaxID=568872 RepID=A0A1C6RUA3_9ACTN|nr:hypothetical protein [Micromonospora rhizosphaerae]SCL20787.1 hypothetical protein GA0070624_2114 [Micromonospora rhizosphaerae]
MTRHHPNGPAACFTARLAGASGLLAVLAFLAVAGLVAWVFSVKLPEHEDEIQRQSQDRVRLQADRFAAGLRAAAADGRLTDEEIAAAPGAPRQWFARRTDGETRIVARFLTDREPVCRAFVLREPLGTQTAIRESAVPGDCAADVDTH